MRDIRVYLNIPLLQYPRRSPTSAHYKFIRYRSLVRRRRRFNRRDCLLRRDLGIDDHRRTESRNRIEAIPWRPEERVEIYREDENRGYIADDVSDRCKRSGRGGYIFWTPTSWLSTLSTFPWKSRVTRLVYTAVRARIHRRQPFHEQTT